MTRLGRSAAAFSTAAALLLGGCSIDFDALSDSDEPTSSSGGRSRSFEVDEAGVTFDLPAKWEEFDRERMNEALSNSSTMDDLTDRMGLTSDQFRQLMASNIVLYVTAPHASGGFLDNVNVLVFDGALPSKRALELQYRALGATHVRSEDVETDAGDGYGTTYDLEVGRSVVHGEALSLDAGRKTVVITVSTDDTGDTADLVQQVTESLVSD